MNRVTCTKLLDVLPIHCISESDRVGLRSEISNASEDELEGIHYRLRRKAGSGSPQHKRVTETGVK